MVAEVEGNNYDVHFSNIFNSTPGAVPRSGIIARDPGQGTNRKVSRESGKTLPSHYGDDSI